jgi:SAM-dependent methyltransferase
MTTTADSAMADTAMAGTAVAGTAVASTTTTSTAPFPAEPAADFASAAALLEIGDRLGLLTHLDSGDPVSPRALAAAAHLPEAGVANYLEAMVMAEIVEEVPGAENMFRVVPEFMQIRYEAGYASWTMNANRPFIENAREFLESPEKARSSYLRDFRQVAVASQWVGAVAFYAAALSTILDERPRRVVDLGAGTARLLIEILRQCPDTTAVALDLDAGACAEAGAAATRAQVGDRLTVVTRSIESLASDPSPVSGADVIHGGFVFHDLMPQEESQEESREESREEKPGERIADLVLRQCLHALNPGGILAITDAVPYVTTPRERRFSAAMTYFHHQFMGRRLLTEAEWTATLIAAGFDSVTVVQHRFPSGRLYVARKR